jgi:hypothetical protein
MSILASQGNAVMRTRSEGLCVKLGLSAEAGLPALIVRLPNLDDESNRQMKGEDIVCGIHEGAIDPLESEGSREADVLYESTSS